MREGAAELLGVDPGTLRNRLEKRGIPYGKKARPRRGSILKEDTYHG